MFQSPERPEKKAAQDENASPAPLPAGGSERRRSWQIILSASINAAFAAFFMEEEKA
jgi:hypothetical protein